MSPAVTRASAARGATQDLFIAGGERELGAGARRTRAAQAAPMPSEAPVISTTLPSIRMAACAEAA